MHRAPPAETLCLTLEIKIVDKKEGHQVAGGVGKGALLSEDHPKSEACVCSLLNSFDVFNQGLL